MPTTEHTINDALAERLRATRHLWQSSGVVSSETTGTLAGTNGRPDILIVEPNVSPVVIETELFPAVTVEGEATARLGARLSGTGRKILSSIAVRLPQSLKTKAAAELRDELGVCKFEMAFYTGTDAASCTRWPLTGWITGDIDSLSVLAQSASLPPAVIEAAADQLVEGVRNAAAMLNDMAASQPASIHKISVELHQKDGEQTRRMASTILANAFLFHETLAGGPGALADVLSLEELRGSDRGLNKASLLAEWRKILKVNYWPIFDIARRIMETVPAANSGELIDRLSQTASRLLESRLMRSHDLTGAVFQKLIADRKFLAAYYTTPASAALLVGLAVTENNPPVDGSWSSADDIIQLRVADFACGTGTLLSTAYQRITQLHELAGGDAATLHARVMATGLVGCDVLPAAAHLTASMLSGAQPTVTYQGSSIMTVPYGNHGDEVVLGSLDLLRAQGAFDVLTPATSAKVTGGTGETARDPWLTLPHATFDLVIMNPPFTRATGHEGDKIGVHNPMFAAFSMSEAGQRAMAKVTQGLTAGTSAHGNAGEASIFLVLADRKLKPNGTLALVMPLSLLSGEAWEESRRLLATEYSGLILVTIAGGRSQDMSFSADTNMGECLVVGRKSVGSGRAVFVVLNERPQYPLLGASAAREINQLISTGNIRRLEDGPVGGSRLTFGNEVIGYAVDAPIPAAGGWNLVRIADFALAQTAYQMTKKGHVWRPGMNASEAFKVALSTVAAIGEIGP